MSENINSRILLIDDEEVIRDSIRLILNPPACNNHYLDVFAADLFEDDAAGGLPPAQRPRSHILEITVDEASNGRAGVAMVQAAVAAGRPYAAVFVDMRMPGWDGIETVQHLREIDRQAEVVFITAFSDHSIENIVERAGPNVGYHLKPFAPDEIKQIATKAIYDWNKLRRLEGLIDLIGALKVNATELDALLNHVFHQVANWIGTESALLARRLSDGHYERVLCIGSLRQEKAAAACLDRLSLLADQPDTAIDPTFICFRLERYELVALVERSARANPEKIYLLELFTRHAGQAIENLRLHETVMRAEKLAAVGLAIGKVAHDMRSPVAAIQGAIDFVRTFPDDRVAVAEMLNLMYTSSQEALSLADDLLDYTRNAPARQSVIRAEDLFQAIRQRMYAKCAAHGILLQLESDPGETFHADVSKLQRLLLNLIQNAAEALESNATPQPAVHLRIARVGENMRFEVADNGPGIPASIVPTLFEPFTTYGKPGGTGLGLAIVRQAAEVHGGSVNFTTSSAGTCFEILLPQTNHELAFAPASDSEALHSQALLTVG